MSINGYNINGSEALDEEAYQLWLRDPNASVVHLVEIDYKNDQTLVEIGPQLPLIYTVKLSDSPYPPYYDIVKSIPSVSRRIGDNFTGVISASIGTLELHNVTGVIDSWLNLNISGREVRIFHGAPDWPIERFRRVMTCIAERVSAADDTSVTIMLRGQEVVTNTALNTATFDIGVNEGVVIPLAYGTVFNVEPKLYDSATSTYQWHNGVVSAVTAVRDNGYKFETDSLTVTAVDSTTNTLTITDHGFFENTRVVFSGTPPTPLAASTDYWVISGGLTTSDFRLSLTRGGSEIDITNTTTGATCIGYHWTAELSTGKILMDSKPAGQVTLDGSGYASGGFINLAADILPVIMGISSSQFNKQSQDAFRTTCPQPIGYYARERTNRMSAVDDIMRGLGSWYGQNRYGQIILGRLERSPVTATNLYESEMLYPLKLERMIMPRVGQRMGYAKNWTIQKSGLAAAVTEDNAALYGGDCSYTIPAAVLSTWPSDYPYYVTLVERPDALISHMTTESDAVTERSRLDSLYYGYSGIFQTTVGMIGFEYEIGQPITVYHSRYGFSSGLQSTIVGLDDDISAGTVTVSFHTYVGTYTPGQL